MVVLRVPVNDVDLNDEDLGCSWEEQMMKQGDDSVEARKENLEEGDILAMLDRNFITEQFERRVFVLVATEEYVLVFDEKGEPIDEPGSFVEGGWQRLHGDHSFMEEWIGDDDDGGYYKLGVQPEEAPAPAPTTDPAPAPAAAAPADAGTITGTIAAIMKPGVRIQECFKESADDPVGKWYGELVVAVTDENCLIACDDGDMSVHSRAEIRGLVEMARLKVLEDARGLVADMWQADKACAVSYLRVKEKPHPVGALLGDDIATLCGKPIYSSHHLSLDLVESVTSSSKATRPSRGAGGAGDDKRGGLATFRFGDSVISTGLVGAEGSATETVFGVMSLSHRKQQHRYIISYDEQLEQFAVGSWTAWRRIPTEGQASEH